mmetsp:Transcript_26796/g.86017  ORF Transcript_26796/g.86017 Transcript_26796/m.86017 type:complete len:262 (+) Transcript_26796:83-868(+)
MLHAILRHALCRLLASSASWSASPSLAAWWVVRACVPSAELPAAAAPLPSAPPPALAPPVASTGAVTVSQLPGPWPGGTVIWKMRCPPPTVAGKACPACTPSGTCTRNCCCCCGAACASHPSPASSPSSSPWLFAPTISLPSSVRTVSSLPSSSRTRYGATSPGAMSSARCSTSTTVPAAHLSPSSASKPVVRHSTASPGLKRSVLAFRVRFSGVARQLLKVLARNCSSSPLPMKTIFDSRGSPGCHASSKPPEKVMCTAW